MNKKCVVGIDIGGTSVKLGSFDLNGNVLDKWSIDTLESYSGEMLIEKITESVSGYINENDFNLCSVGMGVPGSVNEAGIVAYAPNVGWSDFDAAGLLSDILNVPVAVQNDANTAALGELKCGSGKDKSSICFLTLGTGVGGGLVVGDRIITGFAGCGGEIGHIIVNPNETTPCNCGRYGCLEQYASATGIARLAKKHMDNLKYAKDSKELPTEFEKYSHIESSSLCQFENVTAKEVFDCVKQGDKLAIEIAEEFGKILGSALSNIACIFNPQIFVIGGGVSNAGDILIQYVQKYFVQNAYSDCKKTEFAIASLANDAGIYGASQLAIGLLK